MYTYFPCGLYMDGPLYLHTVTFSENNTQAQWAGFVTFTHWDHGLWADPKSGCFYNFLKKKNKLKKDPQNINKKLLTSESGKLAFNRDWSLIEKEKKNMYKTKKAPLTGGSLINNPPIACYH